MAASWESNLGERDSRQLMAMTQLYLPTLMADIVNIGIINGYVEYIVKTGLYMLLVASCGGICAITAAFLASQIAMGFGKIVRTRIFAHVSEFSLQEFDKLGTPSLITRNTNDVTQVQMALLIMLRMMILAPITCVGAIVMALSKDRELWWVIAVMVPVLAVSITLIASKAFPLFQAIQSKIDRINLVLREGLAGIRVIRAFNRVEHERERFQAYASNTERRMSVT